MDTESLRQIISSSVEQEQASASYLLKLRQQAPLLPSIISLPKENPEQALQDLVVEYIQHIPDFIDCVDASAQKAGIAEFIRPFLDIALNYFTEDRESQDGKELEEILKAAYLAHRLFEEVNDHYIQQAGFPLIPLDTTKANLIIHALIGEPLNHQLDARVIDTAEDICLPGGDHSGATFQAYIDAHRGPGWDEVWENWSSLGCQNVDLDLKF